MLAGRTKQGPFQARDETQWQPKLQMGDARGFWKSSLPKTNQDMCEERQKAEHACILLRSATPPFSHFLPPTFSIHTIDTKHSSYDSAQFLFINMLVRLSLKDETREEVFLSESSVQTGCLFVPSTVSLVGRWILSDDSNATTSLLGRR